MTQAEALQNLPELFQFWLQDQINTCVQGHNARISRMEERIERLVYEITVTQEAAHRHEVELIALRKGRT